MHLSLLLCVLVALFISSSAAPYKKIDGGFVKNGPPRVEGESVTEIADDGSEAKDFQNGEEDAEEPDFEDDDSDQLMNLIDSYKPNIHSVTHLHNEHGEILVPCFGMWWPVGGGPVYDYGVDYDTGDDGKKKKKRRARKQRKARMKRKKS